MERKYNFTYQTKNLINDKLYVGAHTTDNIKDGYIGCGITRSNANYNSNNCRTPFQKAVKKYGYNNFSVQILDYFDTPEQAFEDEAFIVDEDWVKRTDTYNLVLGGGRPPLQTRENYPRTKEYNAEQALKRAGKKSAAYISDIYQIDITTGKILGAYHTANQAGLAINKDGHGIAKVLRGDALIGYGYFWTREPHKWQEEYNSIKNKHYQVRIKRSTIKSVRATSVCKKYTFDFTSMGEAYRWLVKTIGEKEYSIHKSLSTVKKDGSKRACYGYYWEFI